MGWKKVKLKEVLKQYRVQHIVQDDVVYKQVTISKYDGVTYRGTKIGKEIGRKRQFIVDLKNYPNTLMLVRQGVQDGSIGIAPPEVDGCIATENMPMFSVEGIDLEYLRFLLKSPYFFDELNKIETTGSAQKSIHERQILEIEIPLPSIEEQKQFVKELTKLKNGGLEISSELTHQLDLIKQLRQAFLREAMQGKLCHAELVSASQETGHELLAKIKAEKAQLIAEKKLKKEKELPPITADEIPFEIPEHWAWCRLGEICSIKGGKRVPNGYKLLKEPTPYIYIRVSDMKNGTISDNDLHYIDENVYQGIKQYTIGKDDIYMTIVGGTIGKCGLVPEKFDNMNLTENAAKITPILVDKKFLWKCLDSPFCQSQFIDKTKQVGVQKMALNRFSSSLIPLPPLHEQEQIVAKLEELTAYCDGLEQSIKESQGYNEKLLQQVLREALQPQ